LTKPVDAPHIAYVEGPDLTIGNRRAELRSGKELNFRRFGLNEFLKKDSHSGINEDISGPESVIVESFKTPL
jgi:hypothetical protein